MFRRQMFHIIVGPMTDRHLIVKHRYIVWTSTIQEAESKLKERNKEEELYDPTYGMLAMPVEPVGGIFEC